MTRIARMFEHVHTTIKSTCFHWSFRLCHVTHQTAVEAGAIESEEPVRNVCEREWGGVEGCVGLVAKKEFF